MDYERDKFYKRFFNTEKCQDCKYYLPNFSGKGYCEKYIDTDECPTCSFYKSKYDKEED